MTKKKIHDQEDPEQKKHFETADNKENSEVPENTESNKTANQALRGTTDQKPGDSAPEGTTSDKVVIEEKSFEEKLAEMQDKYIRLSAEFDNYRKRTLREKMEITKCASENLLIKILPVMDDFERAISNMEMSTDCTAIKEGIDLIYGKFSEFLKQNGVREIESLNCPFNVELHDAVAKAPIEDEDKKGKIVDVILKGYYLQNKVIRHSKVVIGE
jgi:molecular chaperone GrpE